MARILTRPMFRKGGLSRETGIMSGLDRKGYARGSYAPRVGYWTGSPPPLSGYVVQGSAPPPLKGFTLQGATPPTTQSGSQIASEAAKKVRFQGLRNLLNRFPGLAKRMAGRVPLTLSQSAAAGPVAGMIAPVVGGAAVGIGGGMLTDWITRAYDTPEAYAYRKKLVKDDPFYFDETNLDVGEGMAKIKELDVGEKPGLFPRGGIKKWRKDRGLDPETGKKIVVPEKEKPDLTTNNDLDTKVTGDMESDLMRAYKEYAPIFEKELGVSPDDTKKQLWMQLAKFGTGLMAQPGGDLVGAVGRAAEKPLEGAGAVVKDVSTAKRQAKLLALQTAITENQPGNIGKALKDIAKAYNFKGKDRLQKAAAIYEKWQRNDTTARAATNKRYAEQAEKLGLVKDNQNRFIAEANEIADKHPELIGQFNNKLPQEEDKWEVGGYYVTDTGRLIRVVEQEGKKVRIGIGEPGFSDKKKTKK